MFDVFEWWKVGWWAVGTFGVVGTIVVIVILAMYFPLLLRQIVDGIVRLLGLVLSYRIGCALVAAIVVGVAVDYWRHSTDDAAFAERTRQFEQAQVDRDKRIAQETRETVWTEIANETAANTKVDEDQKEFHDVLAPLPANDTTCRVGPNVDRLRRIAGQAVGKPAGPKRVPATRRARGGT